MSLNNSSSTVYPKQNLSTNNSSTSGFYLRFNTLPSLIFLFLLLLLLLILIFLLIIKCSRKKPRKIQRQGVIIKKNLQSTTDDQHSGTTIDNIRCLADMLISDRKTTEVSSDTPRYSTVSMTNNAVNEINDIDDLSDLDLNNIPLRFLQSSNSNPNDPSLVQPTKRSSYSSSENLYLNEYQERAAAAKQYHNHRVSVGSKTSEESCL